MVLCIGCNSTLCAVINIDSTRRAVFVADSHPMTFQHEVPGQTPPELASMMFPLLLSCSPFSFGIFFLSSFWVALIKEPLAQCDSLLVWFCKTKLSNPNLFTWLYRLIKCVSISCILRSLPRSINYVLTGTCILSNYTFRQNAIRTHMLVLM